jgi:hypothetical protein
MVRPNLLVFDNMLFSIFIMLRLTLWTGRAKVTPRVIYKINSYTRGVHAKISRNQLATLRRILERAFCKHGGGGGGPGEVGRAVPIPILPPHVEAVLRLQHPRVHAPPNRGRLPREPRPRRYAGRGGGVRGGEEAAGGGQEAGGGLLALRPQVQEHHGGEAAVIDEGERKRCHAPALLLVLNSEFTAFA